MEPLAPELLFYTAAILSILWVIITCVILFRGIKHLNPYAFFYLIAGICSVGVGERVCYVWLGVNFPLGYYDPYSFLPQVNFITKTLTVLIIFFAVLIFYCHICYFIIQYKSRKKNNSFYKYAVPISVVFSELSVFLLHFMLWYIPYTSMINQAVSDLKGKENIGVSHRPVNIAKLKSFIKKQVQWYGQDVLNYFLFSKNIEFKQMRKILKNFDKSGLYRFYIFYYASRDRRYLAKSSFSTLQPVGEFKYKIDLECLPGMLYKINHKSFPVFAILISFWNKLKKHFASQLLGVKL